VNNGQGAHCSGVMIGPKLAVTAAHCLWNRRTRAPMPVSSLVFVAGWEKGQYLAASRVAKAHTAPGWSFTEAYGPAPASHDWALLELEEPLGAQVGWIGLGDGPVAGAPVVTVGYGQDRPHVPTAHIGCHVTARRPEGLFLHDCDAVHGDSGGPVMAWRDGGLRLVAIHVATLSSVQRVDGGAVGVQAFADAARRLGAAADTRPGSLSRPATMDLGQRLGTGG
ncbi:MAG: trypsin-like serine peptidase, partial [Actinomycetota bacterium]